MNNCKWHVKTRGWLAVWLLAFSVAGCGSGGGDSTGTDTVIAAASGSDTGTTTPPGTDTGTGTGIPIVSQDPVPGAPGAIPPGSVPSGTSASVSGPSVTFSSPAHGATNVAIATVGSGNVPTPRTIRATFSEAMNPASLVSPALVFTVKETISGNRVAGSVRMDAANTAATFTPNAILASNTQFTAVIGTAATNPAGTPLISSYAWSFTTGTQIGQAPVDLATAAGFLVLGGTSIENFSSAANPTRVNGQLGIDPGSTTNVTGFTASPSAGSGIISTGGIQFGPVVRQAKTDLLAALADAQARSSQQVTVGSQDLATFMVNGGSPGVYPPGLYSADSALALTAGNMVLDARGDPDAVWVFKAATGLTVADTRQVLLRNGAQARNVFWSPGTSANLGDQVSFKGNILAGTSNTIGTATAIGSTVEGRVLSRSGLVLYSTIIHAPAP